jgi:D-glucosaminate-6-phosphate ammonia-lyase
VADPMPNLTILRYLKDEAESPDPQSIYRAIGIEPVINCRGTFTIIGGSVERPEVLAAYKAASREFVQYDELAEAVGRRLAEVTGAEWGLVSDGCAAGLKHVTAACVTGGNPEKLIRIPDLTGMDKTQVIIPAYSRNAYDHALRNIGVEIVTVETADELARSLSARTAMIYVNSGPGSMTGDPLSLENIVAVAKPAGVPVLVDAAAENLSIPCVHLERGADVVVYSGGKAMCGPQGAGLVLGKKSILMAAWQASSPHHGPNRDNKVGREEILGMLAAVEAWVTRDHDAEWQTWLARLDFIAARVKQIAGVEAVIEQPAGLSNRAPVLVLSWDPAALHITGEEVAEDFARKQPRIAIGSGDTQDRAALRVTPSQMQPSEEEIVAERIYAILSQDRPPRAEQPTPAAVDVTGHWDFTIAYAAGVSRHRLYLQQEGNWIAGTHHSDFSQQEIVGQIAGNEVKLRSEARSPGDRVLFVFTGEAKEDTISGSVFLGEYLTATFSAERVVYTMQRRPITVPGGPPLAT